MKRIRVGVVGAGFAGSTHVQALRRLPHVEVVALAGRSADRARASATRLGVARSYGDYRQMLRDEPLDAVHICTPNQMHAEVTLAAIDANVHVVSEKPLGMDREEARCLAQRAESSGIVAAVCFNYRYYPLVRQVKAVLANGDVGRPHLVHGSYLQDWLLLETDWNWRLDSRLGGSSRAIADIGSHWLDLVQYVTGDVVEDVVARLGTLHAHRLRSSAETVTPASGEPAECDSVKIDTEDFGSVLLRFAGGCQGVLTVSQVSAGRKNWLSFEIDARDAALSWNQERPDELWIGHRDEPNQIVLRDPTVMDPAASALSRQPAGHPEGWIDTFANLFSDFYSAVAASAAKEPYRPSFATFEDAHRISRTVEAIIASHRLGRAVRVDGER
jgi:predicted dehydrogenase